MNIRLSDLLPAKIENPQASENEDARLINSTKLKFYNGGSGDFWTMNFQDDLIFLTPAGNPDYPQQARIILAASGTNSGLNGQWTLEDQDYSDFNQSGDAGIVNVGYLKSYVQDALANTNAPPGLTITNLYLDADTLILETSQGVFSADISALRSGGDTLVVEQNLTSNSTTSVPSVAAVAAAVAATDTSNLAKLDAANTFTQPQTALQGVAAVGFLGVYSDISGANGISIQPQRIDWITNHSSLLTIDVDNSQENTLYVSTGHIAVIPPVTASHIANKGYVDTKTNTKADLINGKVNPAQIPYIAFTPVSIRTDVANGTWYQGQLISTTPAGSTAGMKFVAGNGPNNYVYEYMLSSADANGTKFIWVRYVSA